MAPQTGYTQEQIEAMRDWAADCYSHDIFFDIDDLSDQEVIAEVESEYDGGISQFMEDGDFWEPN